MSLRLTNVTNLAMWSTYNTVGVKHASTISTVVPEPCVTPRWQPPPAAAGTAGRASQVRIVAAIAIRARGAMSFPSVVDAISTPRASGRFPLGSVDRLGKRERLIEGLGRLHPQGEPAARVPHEDVACHELGLDLHRPLENQVVGFLEPERAASPDLDLAHRALAGHELERVLLVPGKLQEHERPRRALERRER